MIMAEINKIQPQRTRLGLIYFNLNDSTCIANLYNNIFCSNLFLVKSCYFNFSEPYFKSQ